MNKIYCFSKSIFLALLFVVFSGVISLSFAQLTGTKSIPGDYASITAAVADLNTLGVGTGGVTFNVAPGFTESITAPILLTATGSSGNPIVFQRNGAGVNPLITRTDAGTLLTTALGGQGDAVIIIEGSDYVTFDGINVATNDAGIEYGYYLRKTSVTDGCKYVTIKNAVIDLTKGTSAYVVGIYSSNNDAASLVSSATGITVTSTGGRNENITLTSNTIQDVFAGIVLRGFNHTTAPYDFYDQNFVVGAISAGNTIQNFAGNSAASAYGVYLIYHNNASVNYNYINNLSGGGTGATSTFYGIFNSTGATSVFTATNNLINVTTSAAASGLFGINTATTGNLSIDNNNITLNATITTTGSLSYIYNNAANVATLVSISNNTFVGTTYNSTGTTYLIYNNSSQLTPGVANVHHNVTSGTINRTGISGTFYGYYNNGSPTGIENVYNNTFSNITLAGTSAFTGILSTTGASHTHNIYNNNINTITSGSGLTRGIHLTLATRTVYNNVVYGLVGGGTVYGYSNGSGNASIYGNAFYNLQSSTTATTAGLVEGMYISGSNNTYIYNNFISDLKTPTAASTEAIRGIDITSTAVTSTIGLYYNTIYLDAVSSGTNFGTSGIFHTNSTTATTAALDMRNNIVINKSTPAGTGLTVAFRRSAANASLNNYSTLSNKNDFYAGTPGASNLIFSDGTNSDQSIADFKARVTPREDGSFTENVAFVNTTTKPYDLHVDATIPTRTESKGTPITTPIAVTTDFDGNTRNVSTPDVGADEFGGILLDDSGPSIIYTSLLNTSATAVRVLTANITDVSNVPTSGIGLPVLYWAINSGTYNAVQGVFVSGSQYSFTFGAGVATGDTVKYYIVAQDLAATPNVGAFPIAGVTGLTANPPAAATSPTIPSKYIITAASLAGDYTVGLALFNSLTGKNISFQKSVKKVTKEVFVPDNASVKNTNEKISTDLYPSGTMQMVEVEEISWIPMENGKLYTGNLYAKKIESPEINYPEGTEGVYATITAAVTDLNLRGVGGATNFLLGDASYPTETFPIVINVNNDYKPTASNKVTIKPNTGVSSTISGSVANSRIFTILNSYVTIDGSNSGGTSRDLTISNTNITTPQVLLIGSVGTVPITNVTVKNCNIINGVNTSSAFIVSDGAGAAGWFSNITIQNNSFKKAYIGIYNIAVAASGNGSGLNIINNDLSSTGVDAIRLVGIYVQGVDGATVSQNTIANFDGTTGEDDKGIWLATGTVNSVVERNNIYALKYTGTIGYGVAGIAVSTSTTNASVTVKNNLIYNLSGDGWAYTSTFGDNPFGIYLFGTQSGVQAYYNSINLYGNTLNQTSAISAGIALGTGTTADVKDNNIVNNLGLFSATGLGSIGIFLQTGISQLSSSNYNNIFVAPTGSGVKNIAQTSTNAYILLSDWQSASTLDLQSVSSDPNFVSSTDLRPKFPSPVVSAGTPISGITSDYLGVTRSATTPSIGAYEKPFATIGWANLQWPSVDSTFFGQSRNAYAQIWIDGITNQVGAGSGILAWIGVSSTNDDPSTWTTWIPAVFNVDAGNNDEFMAAIGSTLAPGTYYFASRFNVFGGDYVYGGYNAGGGGFWNGTTNVSGVLVVRPAINNVWQRSVATATLPTWFSSNTERGFAYGLTSNGTEAQNDRLFVVSRNGGNIIKVLDASTGNDISTLDNTGITGGTFPVNDASVSEDGKIFVCNLAAGGTFKVYMWENEVAVPTVALSYATTNRLGDKFTVIGSYVAGTAQIWAASSTTGQHVVYKWSMSAGVFDPTPVVITCSDNIATGIASAAVGPLPNGDFYWNSNGQNLRKYQSNGTLIGIVPNTVVGTGSNAVRYLGKIGTNEVVATFAYGTGNENARILEIPNGNPTQAFLYAATPTLGGTANSNGTGDVEFKLNSNLTATVFVLGSNNGIGAYTTESIVPVELTSFAATIDNNRDVKLVWSTATETNNNGFEVQRKANSELDWTSLGFIRSAGTTTEPQNYSFVDSKLNAGSYTYRLKITDFDGSFEYSNIESVEIGTPINFAISQNYPNPFNPTTRIDYQVPAQARVTLELYSITGEKVATLINNDLASGYYTVDVNASSLGLASGVYIYRIVSMDVKGQKFVDSKKMMLLK